MIRTISFVLTLLTFKKVTNLRLGERKSLNGKENVSHVDFFLEMDENLNCETMVHGCKLGYI